MKLMKLFLVLGFAVVSVLTVTGCEEQNATEDVNPQLTIYVNPQQTLYVDPKGYFVTLPPTGWQIQEYPEDPRGHVAFIDTETGDDLRVLVKAVNIQDMDGLISNVQRVERNLGVNTNIGIIVFNDLPAVKRTCTVTLQGVTCRVLWIDLLIDGFSHNIQFTSTPSGFESGLDRTWKYILTYEPISKPGNWSMEKVKKHTVARWLSLATIYIETGNTIAAKEAINAGLEADPTNEELLQLKAQINDN